MKTLIATTIIAILSSAYASTELPTLNLDNGFNFPGINAPNPKFIKKEESPWPGAITKTKTIHKKTVEVEFTGFKVTALGYGTQTPKVISLDLANHTLLDHRNLGEEGPCLAGFPGWNFQAPTLPAREMVTIEVRNHFTINEEKGICQVRLEEIVTTKIEGENFSHHLSQDMGFRFIDDCQ